MISLTIPGEVVSLNNAYRTYVDRKTHRLMRAMTAEGKQFKARVKKTVRAAQARPPVGRLALTLHFYGRWDTLAGKPRRRDVTNAAKLAEDAICEALGIDDCWIRRVELEATHEPDSPRIEVTLRSTS